MRVGVFRHSLYLPSEQFISSQATNLRSSDVTMISRDAIRNPIDELLSVSIRDLGRLAVLRHTLLKDPRPLERLLRDCRIDLVHAHFGVEGMYSRKAAFNLGIPHVVTLHGFDASLTRKALLASKKPAWVYYSFLRSQLLTSGSYFVCVSKHVQKLAIELGAKSENTVVIGTGVDTRQISQSIVPTDPIVLHVARLVENKGAYVLLEAFREVLRTVADAKLRIIGEGPLLDTLVVRAASLGIEHAVQFLGVQPHSVVISELRKARVLALPSITAASGAQEGLGQVLLEAGATGRPVVATNHGGIVDGVIDGITGFLVPEKDHFSLAEALVRILEDDDVAGNMGREARRFVERNYDVAIQSSKLEDFYRLVN